MSINILGCGQFRQGKEIKSREVRGDRWVIVTRCESWGATMKTKDDGQYDGTPRPEPWDGWK